LLITWCETDDPNELWANVVARIYSPDMSNSVVWPLNDGAADPTSAFDAQGNFVIAYGELRGTDRIGTTGESGQTYAVMYPALEDMSFNAEGYPDPVRNEFRLNSASLNSGSTTRWSGHQSASQIMLDADGDITGVYEGFGPDVSDSVFIGPEFFANWINTNKNADLLPYLGGLFSESTPESGNQIGDYTDMDSVIEYVLATAASSGANDEQIGRLNAVLASAANMLRGEANGVFFSSFDADWRPGAGALNVLAQDSVVNNQRDGQNTRYILQLDSRATDGDIILRIRRLPNLDGTVTGAASANIEIALPYPNDQPLNADGVATIIENELEGAFANAYWLDNLWSGTVTVRRVDNIPENSIRMGTPWAWPDNQGFYVAYEISFAGDMHDIDMGLSLVGANRMKIDNDTFAAPPQVTQYAYGNDGQYQGEASAAMQPNGNFVVAWTAWEEMTDGIPGATNIYFREFNETVDNVGPRVTDFLLADGSRLKQGGQVQDPMQYVVVTFTEAMNTASATHSVLNPENWSLINVETGAEINGGISQILYGMNISVDLGLADVGSNKWEAVLVIDANGAATPGTTPLTNGHYRIVAKNSLRDVPNNPLNSNGYNENGGNFARDFHITTNPQTDIPVNPTSPGDQFLLDPSVTNTANLPNSPQSIAGDADGRHVIVWTDEGAGLGVFARVYNVVWTETAEGERLSTTAALTEFRVTDNPTAVYAAVAMDGDGDFVVTWSQNDGTPSQPDWNVWYRRYDATGQPLEAARMANSHTAGAQRFSAVAMDVDGDFVITWQSHAQDGSGYGIYAQRFARSGELIGGLDEIQVLEFNGDPDMVSFALNFDGGVTGAIVYTGDLGDVADRVEQEFALLGVEVDAWVMSNREVAIRFLGADGRTDQAPILIDFVTVVGDAGAGLSIRTEVEGEIGEFLVNDTTLGDQVHPSIAMDASGSFVISWTSFGQDGDAPYQSNIYAKQFASNDVVAAGSASAAWVGAVNADTPPVVGIGPAIVTTGDPEDYEVGPGYDGVGRVQAGSGMGTGSLLMSGYHVITAAHVVADDFGNALPVNTISVTFNLPEGNLTINAVEVYIHPDYNGNFAAGGDIAIIVLAEAPPATVERYDIYRGANQIGSVFEKWGYGRSGTGQTGSTLDAGTERRGWNRYEMFSREFGGAPDGLAYDFDSGAAANDAFGIIWGRNDLGLGDDEAMTAQGDSGGPNFINGLIAGITSYHTTYGSANGDIDGQLNSSFGEIGVDVDVSLYANWIDAAMRGTPEMRINQTVAGNQKWSSVAMDADGDFVITWTSYGQDGTGSGPGSGVNGENGVYARRFNKDSSPVSDEFQVNTFTDKNQQRSRVAMDVDGDFIIVWESFQDRPTGAGPDAPTSYGVYARRYVRTSLIGMSPSYGPNGELGGELRMNTETAGDQRYPAVALSDTGDAVFVWSGNGPGDAQGIFTKRLFKEIDDAGPMVTDVHTVVTDGSSVQLDVVGEDTIIYTTVNRFVVTFGEQLDITHGSRGAQSVLNPDHWQVSRVHDDGTVEVLKNAVVTVEFGLNKAFDKGIVATPSDKFEAVVSFDGDSGKAGVQALEDGKYILTIKQNITDIFDNPLDGNFDGTPGGDYLLPFTVLTSASEIRVNGNPLGDQTFTNENLPISETPNSPRSVASDADGDYAVVWTSEGVNTGVYVKLYDTAWLRESDGTRTPVFNTKQPINPATGLPWLSGEILVTDNPTATHASIAMDADGDFVVTWSQNDGTTASPDWNVYAQWYTAEGMPKGVTNETQVVALDADVMGSFALEFNGATTALVSWTGNLAATAAALQTQLNALGLNTIVRVCGDVELSVTFLGADGAKDQPEFTVAQVNPGAMNVSVTTAWDGKGADAPFRVNTYTSRDQKFSSVAMDHDGEFVITWQSEGQNGSGHEIYAQTYDRFAKPLGMRNELQVISFGATSSGTFTLIYEGVETGVIVHNGDTAQTAAAIEGALDLLGLQTRVVAMGDRDIEILFTGEDGGKNHRQLVLKAGTITNATVKTSQDGKTGEFRVNQAIAGDQVHPAVAMDAVGNFVVTWSSYDTNTTDNDAANIYARQFVWIDNENTGDNEDEHFGGGEFIVNQTLPGEQRWSDVAMDRQGDFVVTWTSVAPIPAGEEETVGIDGLQDVFARRYAFTIAVGGEVPVSNTPVSDEFLVNTYSRGTQQHSSVSMDADGDFVIVWESFQDWPIATSGLLNQPNSLGIQAQAFLANDKIDPVLNPTGRLGGEYAVNGTTDGPQRLPSVALDDTGDVVIVWSGNGQMVGQEDSQGIFMRRVNHADLNDTAGPTVTDVHVVDKTDGEPTEVRVVLEGSVIDNYVGQMVVTFSEDLNTLYGDIGAHSILNPDLWILEKNGRVVEDAVNKIQFGLNLAYTLGLADSPSGKYEAIVTFDLGINEPGLQPLDNGTYVLRLNDDLMDLFGNMLDGNLDGVPGNDFNFAFSIIVGGSQDNPIDPPGPDSPLSDGRTFPESSDAVAVDSDGDYVVAWSAFDAVHQADRVQIRLFDAGGTAATARIAVTPEAAFDGDVQRYASVAMDGDGDFVVTWTNYRDADGVAANGREEVDIYARRYSADGTPKEEAFRVNSYTTNNQQWSAAAMDIDGDFIIVWSSYGQEDNNQLGRGYGVFAQRYDSFGRAIGSEFQVNTTTAGDQKFPSVAMDAVGSFVIVWQSAQNAIGDDIVAREFNADGSPTGGPLGGEFLVNDTVAGNQRWPDVAMNLAGDGYAVTWSSSQQTDDQSGYGVYSKTFTRLAEGDQSVRYTYQGAPVDFGEGQTVAVPIDVDQDFVINDLDVRLTISHEDPSDLFVWLVNPNGDAILLAYEVPRAGDQNGVGAAGTANGANFDGTLFDDDADILITDQALGALPPFSGTFRPVQPLASFNGTLAQGTWLLVVQDNDPAEDPDVYFDGDGNRLHYPDGGRVRDWSLEFTRDPAASNEILVNTTTDGNQMYSSVAMDYQGNFVVTWSGVGNQPGQEDQSLYGVFSQRFNAAASKEGGETRLNTTTEGMQWLSSVGMDGEGNYVAAWTGDTAGGSSTTIFGYVSANREVRDDLVGPIVTDVLTEEGSRIFNGSVIVSDASSPLTTLVVAFGEELSIAERTVGGNRTPAIESILNPSNWMLERNGMEIVGGISQVDFVYNSTLRRWEAVLTLDDNGVSVAGQGGLSSGSYVLSISDLVTDVFGNRLDGDYDGQPETNPGLTGYSGYQIEFSVAGQDDVFGAERRANQNPGYVQTLSEPLGTGYARETSNRSIAVDNDGDYVVVWTSYGQDDPSSSNGAGVYARRYDRNDNPIGDEFRVNNLTAGDQKNASIAMDADGDFIVVWEAKGTDGTWDVYAQRFDAAGNRIANERDDRIPSDPYRNQSGAEHIEILVNTTRAGEQFNPSVAVDSYGNYAIAWGSSGVGFTYYSNVHMQVFDYRGEPVGVEVQVNEPGTGANGGWSKGFKVNPDIAMDADGDIVVAWDEATQVVNGVVVDTVVMARMFDRLGMPPAELAGVIGSFVASGGEGIGGTDVQRMARNPSVARDPEGNFVIAYEAFTEDFDDGPESYNIFFSRF
ncbi:MAG: S1 family peptidase, partial [Pirellulaceae bacterium]|nr:S1 family peptidase [Pirellulaceae bacterium]